MHATMGRKRDPTHPSKCKTLATKQGFLFLFAYISVKNTRSSSLSAYFFERTAPAAMAISVGEGPTEIGSTESYLTFCCTRIFYFEAKYSDGGLTTVERLWQKMQKYPANNHTLC